jgi:hypothetical protein
VAVQGSAAPPSPDLDHTMSVRTCHEGKRTLGGTAHSRTARALPRLAPLRLPRHPHRGRLCAVVVPC